MKKEQKLKLYLLHSSCFLYELFYTIFIYILYCIKTSVDKLHKKFDKTIFLNRHSLFCSVFSLIDLLTVFYFFSLWLLSKNCKKIISISRKSKVQISFFWPDNRMKGVFFSHIFFDNSVFLLKPNDKQLQSKPVSILWPTTLLILRQNWPD